MCLPEWLTLDALVFCLLFGLTREPHVEQLHISLVLVACYTKGPACPLQYRRRCLERHPACCIALSGMQLVLEPIYVIELDGWLLVCSMPERHVCLERHTIECCSPLLCYELYGWLLVVQCPSGMCASSGTPLNVVAHLCVVSS